MNHISSITGSYLKDLVSQDFFRRSPNKPVLINATYHDFFRRSILSISDFDLLGLRRLWRVFDKPDFLRLFLKFSYCVVFNKYFIPTKQHLWWTRFHGTFFPKFNFQYLEGKHWTYIGSCLINTWIAFKKHWIVFNKYFIPEPYLVDSISCDFFFDISF